MNLSHKLPCLPRGKTLNFDEDFAKFTPRQLEAITLLDSGLVKFLLFGGAVGGGKSYLLRWYAVRRLLTLHRMGIKKPMGMICCENYPALKDRQLAKVGQEFPPWLGAMHSNHKTYGCCFILAKRWGGGVIAFRNLDDPSKYASAEFAFIFVDELTKNAYDTFTFLRMRLRWPGLPDIETQFVGATNPGDIGHAWCKQLFLDRNFPDEFKRPHDYTTQFAYVQSKATDNPHLDESYWAMLQTLPEHVRKAFRDGDWNVFLGQAFSFTPDTHVIKPLPIPAGAPVYMTFDWGYGAPFSIGWWWVDGDNRIYRFNEWYGWNGQPNQGLRLTDNEIAEGILSREQAMGVVSAEVIRLAGPDCFAKKPDYRGGGQGPSTAETFAKYKIYLIVGDPSRSLKIRQFRERLYVPKDGTMPMLVVYDTCAQFIRTIPCLVTDPNNIEDIIHEGESHVFDDSCHICMARPYSLSDPLPPLLTPAQADFAIIRGTVHAALHYSGGAINMED